MRKSKRNHVRKAQHEERTKETLETTTSQIITEETSDEGDKVQQVYANYISEVARAIAKARGAEVSEEHINKDIEDMIKFQVKLAEVSNLAIIFYCKIISEVFFNNGIFQIALESGENDALELTLNDFQEWYDEKESKIANSKVSYSPINVV